MRVGTPLRAGGGTSVALPSGPRAVAPEIFWERLRPLLARVGITRVAMVTGLDRVGLPVAMAVRPNARGLAVNHGKGATDIAAKISAAMESLEHWHAEHPCLPARLASWRAIGASAPALHPGALPGTPLRLDRDRPILWVEGRDLANDAPILVPLEAVSTDYALPSLEGFGAFLQTSSGLASGTDLLEATVQALLERIERDAEALWQLRPATARRATRLDAATVDQLARRDLVARIAAAGLRCAVWNLTSDLGVPTFRCLLVEPAPERAAPIAAAVGTGCHLERGPALWRALAEAVQMRLLQITAAREDLESGDYLLPDPRRTARLEALMAEPAMSSFAALPAMPHAGFATDLAFLLERLAAAGLRPIAVDLTNPELTIPVVRVVVPGLEEMPHAGVQAIGRRAAAALGP